MKPGEVVRWINCPFFNHFEQKDRWLVCIGTYSLLGETKEIFVSTTTTKVEEYAPGKKREKNIVFRIDRKKYPFFTNDCLIDLSMNPLENISPNTLQNQGTSWERKGIIDSNDLREIFNRLVRAESVSPKILNILKDSLQSIGLQGLSKVK